ncbi:MAG: aldehyde dehydrogenase family protein [candidate division KSB1 bacterium]|nr:aldehyde dehydrogenase family protein [candidate division KSB1 bacterium]MDZ7276082.1 aldehyde dehydrogenase family protein [candidate division KSB1 bacterium]MDZ7287138.1 aldehyde dehydrogenase family protein [candidate division KSB1 bacterium]MDZ7296937.1 aldehyde dehydrogenase family protein [candidate division KSB1 bacterium]MDZ7307172.1 aldehyde dehydrogenase family protein [candidate division KSB1 bacterium]
MIITAPRGTAAIPEGPATLPPTSPAVLDQAIDRLQAHKHKWATLDIRARIALLDTLLRDYSAIAAEWVAAAHTAKGIDPDSVTAGEEWLGGPLCIHRNLRLLRQSLCDIERYGRPRLPGRPGLLANGQVAAPVMPQDPYERVLYRGISAEVWMQPGVTLDTLTATQAVAYHTHARGGKVALVLGAGNVSSIAPLDALYQLFVENNVVLLKMNPVNACLGPFYERAFRALIAGHFLQVVYGGSAEGTYLCHHPGIEALHMTGSDKTFEAIVFGSGPQAAQRKAQRRPLLTKPFTSELGNVTPVIIVPGPWTDADIAFQAANLATMLANNAGFNCVALRVLVQHARWPLRPRLLAALRAALGRIPTRLAYYPGAAERYEKFHAAHPEAEPIGTAGRGRLPWLLISDLDPEASSEICFTTESFCSTAAETGLAAASVPEYLARAVQFVNDKLWGTLSATLIVHPASLRDPEIHAAVEAAIANLRYGTVMVNHWAGLGYGLIATTWGAFPGHDIYDIQSGTGVVHNTFMFSRPQKSVVRGGFRMWPTPLWFATNRVLHRLAPRAARFEAAPAWWKIPALVATAIRG